MQAYNKAIAAVVVPAILMGLEYFGIMPDMSVSEAVERIVAIVLTAFVVWFAPNRN